MPGTKYFRADISQFKTSMPTVLCGHQLKAVKTMQKSITKFGLLAPVTVSKQGSFLKVIDGCKRLAALQRLQFLDATPENLSSIPYVIVNTVCEQRLTSGEELLPLLSHDKQYNLVMDLYEAGHNIRRISAALYIPDDYVRRLARIDTLSPDLQRAFLEDTLTLSQVYAFASIPNIKAQTKLLEMLGSYVEAPHVIKALQAGETVLNISNENVLVLPSRIYQGVAAA